MVEKYYSRLTVDFQVNKRVCEEIAIIPTKRLRNKIAGYITVRCLSHCACACVSAAQQGVSG